MPVNGAVVKRLREYVAAGSDPTLVRAALKGNATAITQDQ